MIGNKMTAIKWQHETITNNNDTKQWNDNGLLINKNIYSYYGYLWIMIEIIVSGE